MEASDVVVSQEDAQYIIERQRREILSLKSTLQEHVTLLIHQHGTVLERMKWQNDWLDFERDG